MVGAINNVLTIETRPLPSSQHLALSLRQDNWTMYNVIV